MKNTGQNLHSGWAIRISMGLWLGLMLPVFAGTNLSTWVYRGADGRLLYQPTPMGDRILDFSTCGFRQGLAAVPDVPVRETLYPAPAEDGHLIQAAIDRVSLLPLDGDGFRGAILLNPGEYDMTNQLIIAASGVVLRGSGEEVTVLRLSTLSRRELLTVQGSGTWAEVPGASWSIGSKYVPVGARSFEVSDTAGLAVGDRVMVHRPATIDWLHDIGMDAIGWEPGREDQYHERQITRIEGTCVTLDTGLANALDQRYGGGRLFKFTWPARIRNVGVERLRAVSGFDPSITATNPYTLNRGMVYYADYDHPERFVLIDRAEDVWLRNVVSEHFANGFGLITKSNRAVTVAHCRNVNPVGPLAGALRYSFDSFGQMVLVQDCYDEHGRHPFAHRYTAAGPNVFVDCLATNGYGECGPRHRWSTGTLLDNVLAHGIGGIHVRNGGSLDGRGFTGANSVVWNCAGNYLVVNNPPTAQNWLVGGQGGVVLIPPDTGSNEPGIYDATGVRVWPRSLYHAQRQQRLAYSRTDPREYWLGDCDGLEAGDAADAVPVCPTWRAEVGLQVSAPIGGFDGAGSPQVVPFTFSYALDPGERVVGASLSLGLAPLGEAVTEDWIALEGVAKAKSFADLGWLPLTAHGARVLDLSGALELLQDGRLNVAVGVHTAVDWAVLNLDVAHETAPVAVRFPVADAHVQDGSSTNANFGLEPVLATQWQPGGRREAFLRFDVRGVRADLTRARVWLSPLSCGGPTEDGAMLTDDRGWEESGLTWSTRPEAERHVADWIPEAGRAVGFDVTAAVREALAEGGELTLRIATTQPTPGNVVEYAAREHPNVELRPRLEILSERPWLGALPDATVSANGTLGPVAFGVGDFETPAAEVELTVYSSDPGLVPANNIVFGGSGEMRTLTLLPLPGVSGSAVISVVARDGDGAVASNHFGVHLRTGNDLLLAQGIRLEPLAKGQTLLCTLMVTNQAAVSVPGVVVSNRFPGALELLEAVASQGACTLDGESVRCVLGVLPAGGRAEVILAFGAQALGRFTNEAYLHQSTFAFDPDHHVARVVFEVSSDSDKDGLPNSYEEAHGLDPGLASDADRDADGDGLSNSQEYRAGTDPNDAGSRVRLTGIARDGSLVRLRFDTAPGRLLQVEFNREYPASAWEPVGAPVAGTGRPVTVQHAIEAGAVFGVYRLQVRP